MRVLGLLPATIKGKQDLLDDNNEECYICNMPLTVESMETDHVIPTDKGGPTTRWNIKPVCPRCNRLKAARLIWVPVDQD